MAKEKLSLILGVLALVTGFIPYVNFASIFLAIIGIVLAIKGKMKLVADGAPTRIATIGLIISIVAAVISVIVIIIAVYIFSELYSFASIFS